MLLKAVPELISAAILFALWYEPQRFGAEWFRSGVMTLLLEFFVIHASGFMAALMYDPDTPAGKRMLQVTGLGLFYLLFMSAFAWLCFGKLQAIWTGAAPVERDRQIAMLSWALSVVVYLGSVGATVAMDVPRLGVTDAVRDAAGFSGTSTGLWEAEPWRALAGAALYFALMGLSRPLFARWQARG